MGVPSHQGGGAFAAFALPGFDAALGSNLSEKCKEAELLAHKTVLIARTVQN